MKDFEIKKEQIESPFLRQRKNRELSTANLFFYIFFIVAIMVLMGFLFKYLVVYMVSWLKLEVELAKIIQQVSGNSSSINSN